MQRQVSDFIWPFLPPYKGVIPNPKMAYLFSNLSILGIIFPKSSKNYPNVKENVASQIKSLHVEGAFIQQLIKGCSVFCLCGHFFF